MVSTPRRHLLCQASPTWLDREAGNFSYVKKPPQKKLPRLTSFRSPSISRYSRPVTHSGGFFNSGSHQCYPCLSIFLCLAFRSRFRRDRRVSLRRLCGWEDVAFYGPMMMEMVLKYMGKANTAPEWLLSWYSLLGGGWVNQFVPFDSILPMQCDCYVCCLRSHINGKIKYSSLQK